MTYSNKKIAQVLLLSVFFQLTLSSCSYERLPEWSSTMNYGSQLLSDNVEEE